MSAKGSHRLLTDLQPVAEGNIYYVISHEAGAQLGASPLLTSDHGAGRCSAHYQRREVIINMAWLQTPRPITATCLKIYIGTAVAEMLQDQPITFLLDLKAHSMKWNL